jgi:hypothetical protein
MSEYAPEVGAILRELEAAVTAAVTLAAEKLAALPADRLPAGGVLLPRLYGPRLVLGTQGPETAAP